MTPIDPPHAGYWSFHGFPDEVWVTLAAMRYRFKKARWKKPYEGVIEQYRQDVPQNSMHLFVLQDGRFIINHVDADNPDHGRVIEHGLNDTPLGAVVKGALAVGGAALVAGAVVSLVASE